MRMKPARTTRSAAAASIERLGQRALEGVAAARALAREPRGLDAEVAGDREARDAGTIRDHNSDRALICSCHAGARDRGHVGSTAGDQNGELQLAARAAPALIR